MDSMLNTKINRKHVF